MRAILFASGLAAVGLGPASALEAMPVTESVWAIVGDLGQRSPGNLGNNATFGVILTAEGVVLVDSGGSRKGAEAIEQTIRTITEKPVITVINTGGQDHRWLGNDYWRSKGARIIASAAAVADQRERFDMQWAGLLALVGEDGLAGTKPAYATEPFQDSTELFIGGIRIVLRHAGPAHTAGDSYVWLPTGRIAFAGDIVFVERMLGVLPVSRINEWIAAFDSIAMLNPAIVIPGHGPPAPLKRAESDTRNYLAHLRESARKVVKSGGTMTDASRIDQSKFRHLAGAAELAGRNAQAVFEQLEFEN